MLDNKKLKSLMIVPPEEIPLAEQVPTDNLLDLFKLSVYMEDLCHKNSGVGLSAVQVGIPWNLFVMLKENGNECFVNSSYEGIGAKIKSIEGCLSLKNKHGDLRRFEVNRFEKIIFRGQQLKVQKDEPQLFLENFEREVQGFDSIVIQHESDHALGVLISDIGKEITLLGN